MYSWWGHVGGVTAFNERKFTHSVEVRHFEVTPQTWPPDVTRTHCYTWIINCSITDFHREICNFPLTKMPKTSKQYIFMFSFSKEFTLIFYMYITMKIIISPWSIYIIFYLQYILHYANVPTCCLVGSPYFFKLSLRGSFNFF